MLSDATERYERSDKFHDYRKLASLEEYVLIALDAQRVECWCRDEQWDLRLFREELTVELAFVDLQISTAICYA
ncbi:MAG: Uma2 family endonuclease [Gammaproteobacteria bacterium]